MNFVLPEILFLFFRNRYEIMLKCWDASPESRPSFDELVEMMDEVTAQ